MIHTRGRKRGSVSTMMLHSVCDEMIESGKRAADNPSSGNRKSPSVTLAIAAIDRATIITLSSSTEAIPHALRYR